MFALGVGDKIDKIHHFDTPWLAGLTADKLEPGGLGAKDFKQLAQEVLDWIKSP